VSNFIVQALRGEDLTIYGEGKQTRSFCYVDDLVRGCLAMMETPSGFTGPINLGNPAECTVLELARKVIELTGSGSRIVFRPLPADDPRQRRPDIRVARERLAWTPQVSLEQGLIRTIRYFDRLLSHGAAAVRMERPRVSVGMRR
jgi:UDP-glucuronate decarboxylase